MVRCVSGLCAYYFTLSKVGGSFDNKDIHLIALGSTITAIIMSGLALLFIWPLYPNEVENVFMLFYQKSILYWVILFTGIALYRYIITYWFYRLIGKTIEKNYFGESK